MVKAVFFHMKITSEQNLLHQLCICMCLFKDFGTYIRELKVSVRAQAETHQRSFPRGSRHGLYFCRRAAMDFLATHCKIPVFETSLSRQDEAFPRKVQKHWQAALTLANALPQLQPPLPVKLQRLRLAWNTDMKLHRPPRNLWAARTKLVKNLLDSCFPFIF